MCLWLGPPLPWWSAIWGDVTVGEENRGPRSRTHKCYKEHGGGAAVYTVSVARLYILPHIWMYAKHTNGKHTEGGTERWRNSITKTGWQRITRTMMWPTIHIECNNASRCKKSQIHTEKHTEQLAHVRWCRWLSEEPFSVQPEDPTLLWGNHKSINHQNTRPQAGPHTRIYKHRLHYSMDPTEPKWLVFPYYVALRPTNGSIL